MNTPIPFKEPKDPPWESDPGDLLLPSSTGFISDFIYYQRMTAVPTVFGIWTALWCLSTAIKREAWVQWFPDPLYPNLYVILVAPPSICKKSATIQSGVKLLKDIKEGIGSPTYKKIKNIELMCDRWTHQEILDHLSHLGKRVIALPQGSQYRPGASAGITASELSMFLGKEKYNEGMVGALLRLYDTDDEVEVGTISRGVQSISRPYITLLGGTTQDGLRDSIPKAAVGDGLLSRTVVVYQDVRVRRRYKPRPTGGAPDKEELVRRLGWIAEHTIGEHELSKEADQYHKEWYERYCDKQDCGDEDWLKVASRVDTTVLKVSLLLKAQRYSTKTQIGLNDVKDAVQLVETTIKRTPIIFGELTGDEVQRKIKRTENYIRQRKKVSRVKLLRNTYLFSHELSAIVSYLVATDKIEIWRGGNKYEESNRSNSEEYRWKEDEQVG